LLPDMGPIIAPWLPSIPSYSQFHVFWAFFKKQHPICIYHYLCQTFVAL
jgi:hypothetical protein